MKNLIKKINNDEVYDYFYNEKGGLVHLKSILAYMEAVKNNIKELKDDELYLFKAHSKAVEQRLKQYHIMVFMLSFVAALVGMFLKIFIDLNEIVLFVSYLAIAFLAFRWIVLIYSKKVFSVAFVKELIDDELRDREKQKEEI